MKNVCILILSLFLVCACTSSNDEESGPSVSITATGLSDDKLALFNTATFTSNLLEYNGDPSELTYIWTLSTENGQLTDGTISLENPAIGDNIILCKGKTIGEEKITVEVIDATNNSIATASYEFTITDGVVPLGCFDQPKLLYSYNGVNNPYICNFDGSDAESLPFTFDVIISPDGQWFGYNQQTAEGYVMKIQRCDGSETISIPETSGRDYQPRFSPDSKTLYFQRPNPLQGDLTGASAYGDIAAYNIESGQLNFLTSFYQIEESVSNITVSPVNGKIAFIKSDPYLVGGIYEYILTFCILNPENGVVTEIYTFPEDTLNIRGIDWSPQGDNVIFSARLGTLEQGFFRINVTDGSQPFLIYPESNPDFAPPLNPTYYNGGTRIVFARKLNGQDNSNLWSIDANGNDLQQITNTPGDEIMRNVYHH